LRPDQCCQAGEIVTRPAAIVEQLKNRSTTTRSHCRSDKLGKDDTEETNAVEACLAKFSTLEHANKWYIDSGATKYVTGSPSMLHNFIPSSSHFTIRITGEENLPIAGKANVNLAFQSSEIK
jgi:hypothetical protein